MQDLKEDSIMSAIPSPSKLSVKEKIDLYNKLSQKQPMPPLPEREYKPKGFSKKYSDKLPPPLLQTNKSNNQSDVDDIDKSIYPIPKYYYLIKDLSEDEIFQEFSFLYHHHSKLWDSVIDSTRFQPRYGKIEDMEEIEPLELSQVSINIDEIITEVNRVRQHPLAYASVIQSRFEKFVDDFVYRIPTGEYMKTIEGLDGIINTVQDLRSQLPVEPLKPSPELCDAAKDHVIDLAQYNFIGHVSSDGLTLAQRIEKYCHWRGSIGENIRFGSFDATEVVMNLLIDDGLETKGQRKNVLSKEFKYIGSSMGPHSIYRTCCVINFITDVLDKDIIMTRDCKKILKSIDDMKDIDVIKILLTIPYNGDLTQEVTNKILEEYEVILEYFHTIKCAKISYKKGLKISRRTLTWS